MASHLLDSLELPAVGSSLLAFLALRVARPLDSTRLPEDNHDNTQTKSAIMRFIGLTLRREMGGVQRFCKTENRGLAALCTIA